MSFHIGARPDEIAETVLMPGDPLRARWVAETFLDAAVPVNQVRGMLGYTGTWRGQRVTVQASGMGMPSMSIYANELIRDYGAQVLIRIGSAGALQPDLCLRDVVLAQAASSDGSPSRSLLQGMALAPVADFGLLQAAFRAGQGRGIGLHVGAVHSSDTFYDERQDLTDLLQRHRVLAVEMETAELYLLAARYGRRALSVLTISDHMLRPEALSAQDRERGFGDMVEIALAAAFT